MMKPIDSVSLSESRMRILVASHSHPRIVPGGAEITAYHLFKALQTRFDTTVWFLGCGRDSTYARSGSAISQPFSDQEFLYSSSAFDWFKFANRDQKFPSEMIALLQELQPDVLHFHHFINFGVEVFQLARRTLPHASIILTLHEYLAICHHFGQMVTTGKRSLCYEANNVRCNACFPEVNASDFFLRKLYITQFFAEVDQFIAPSHFLADRFVRWGLPAEKIRVIENIIASATEADHQDLQNIDGSLRIGFFGQISWLKGCDVLLGAAELLQQQGITNIAFDIHGDYSSQSPDFQSEFLQRLNAAGPNVVYHGPYQNEHVDKLMQTVDVVIVPSVWWENAPVVIEEALRNTRPVLCSSIGGMAEKIRDGVDGFHFRAGSPAALANLAKRLATDPNALSRVRETMRRPPLVEDVVDKHMALYRELTASRLGLEAPTKQVAMTEPPARRKRAVVVTKRGR